MRALSKITKLGGLGVLLAVLALPLSAQAQTEQPVVRAVMFWMETCGNCHFILDEVLPPLQERYGDQLEILLIELDSIETTDLLYNTAGAYGIPRSNVGVPLLFIGDRALSGSRQIPDELPGLIEQHLAEGGIDFPEITGLEAYLPTGTVIAEDDELCSLQTPCPSEAAQASYPLPSTPLPDTRPAATREIVPTASSVQIVGEFASSEAGDPPSGVAGLLYPIAGAGSAVLAAAAFVLYNLTKARHKKNQGG